MSGRRKFSLVVAEFVGTYVLATAMLAMLVRTNFEFFSGLAAALLYGAFYLLFGNLTGSQLNPAVTVGLWTARKVSTGRAVAFIIAQLLGGFVAWKLGQYFLAQQLSKTATGGVDWRVLIAEGVGAFVFGMAVGAVYFWDKFSTGTKAAVLGGGLFGGILIASLAGNGLLNPAVAIGVRSISWAYIAGPIIGLVLGINIFAVIFTEMKLSSSAASTKKSATAKKSAKK